MKFLSVLLVIFFWVGEALAVTPTVSNVTGTIATGQTLTITGTNMMSENKATWESAFSGTAYGFEGSSPETDGYYQASHNTWDCIYTTNQKVMGSKSLQSHGQGSWTSGDGPASHVWWYPTLSGDVWMRFYVKFVVNAGTIPSNYQKVVMAMSAGSGGIYYLDINIDQWASIYPIDGSNERFDWGSVPTQDKWHLVELHWKFSVTRLYEVYLDGTLTHSGTGMSAVDFGYMAIGMINWSQVTAQPTFNMDTFYDGFAIASSRIYGASTVQVSGNGTQWKNQEPLFISETSQQIKLDLTGLTGSDYQLRVINQRQETSATYDLDGGSEEINGACGTASGAYYYSLDSSAQNLCESGTVASFLGSGPWTWGCNGANGGTSTASDACEAYLSQIDSIFSESFEDGSFASRGWYDNTTHGTIVAGGQTGNCLQWAWAQSGTTPTNGGAMRRLFTPTESLFVEFYVKFSSSWQGSQQTYHPHVMMFPSNLDDDYAPLARNYLNTYVEFVSDIGSPYTVRPSMAVQDQLRVNTTYGTPPNNLTSITENRSVAHCNTPAPTGATGICYPDNPYYSANLWKDASTSVSLNTWHKVQVYFRMNTVVNGIGQYNGIMQQWIDDVQIIDRTDLLYRTGQDATKMWSQFVLAPWIGDGSPIAQTMWLDEITAGYGNPITDPTTGHVTLDGPGSASLLGPGYLTIWE
jgi:hypothetical protein